MAKISALSAGAPALTTDEIAVARSGTSVKLDISDITGIGATIASGTATRVLYLGTNNVLADSANLTFDDTNKRLTVGTGSGTSSGLILGYYGSSGYGGIWSTGVTPTSANYALLSEATFTAVNAPSGGVLDFRIANVVKMAFSATAGAGPSITAGTATTDVAALSVTRTNNDAAVVKGVEITFTDTTSAAGFLPLNILGGSGATTVLAQLSKTGALAIAGQAIPAGGTAGLGLKVSSTSNFGVFFGSGAPSLAAAKGSLYLRSDGTGVADRAYINTDGSTTWTSIATAG